MHDVIIINRIINVEIFYINWIKSYKYIVIGGGVSPIDFYNFINKILFNKYKIDINIIKFYLKFILNENGL